MNILVTDPASFQGFHRLFSADDASPSSPLILRFKGTKFQDVSSEFTPVYDERIRGNLTVLQGLAKSPNQMFQVLSIVLDYLYSGRPGLARKTLDQFWPADDREDARKDIIKEYCGGLRKRLGVATDSTCAAGDF